MSEGTQEIARQGPRPRRLDLPGCLAQLGWDQRQPEVSIHVPFGLDGQALLAAPQPGRPDRDPSLGGELLELVHVPGRPGRAQELDRIGARRHGPDREGQAIGQRDVSAVAPSAGDGSHPWAGENVLYGRRGAVAGHDQDEVLHRLGPAPEPPRQLACPDAGSSGRAGHESFPEVQRLGQEDRRDAALGEALDRREDPALGPLADPLHASQLSRLASGLELGDGPDARGAQRRDPVHTEPGQAAQRPGARREVTAQFLQDPRPPGHVKFRDHLGQARAHPRQITEAAAVHETGEVNVRSGQGVGRTLVGARAVARLPREPQEGAYLGKGLCHGLPIKAGGCSAYISAGGGGAASLRFTGHL